MNILKQLEKYRLHRADLCEALEQHQREAKRLKAEIEGVDANVYALIEEENSPQERLFREDPTDHDEPLTTTVTLDAAARKKIEAAARKAKRGRKAGADPSKVQWPEQ